MAMSNKKELTPYEQEMEIRLKAFKADEPDLPDGVTWGMWSGQRQYVCTTCGVGFLSLDAAVEHQWLHPALPESLPPATAPEKAPEKEQDVPEAHGRARRHHAADEAGKEETV